VIDMENGDERCGKTYTFAVIVRGDLESINNLINFLNESGLIIAHKDIGQEKMYIKKDGNHAPY